jgi:hypothetical protein
LSDLHHDCWQMLPWIVSGRISAGERQRVERHLLECTECREELDEQRALCDLVRGEESVVLAPQASLQKLMSRIDASLVGGSEPIEAVDADAVSPHAPLRAHPIPRWIAVAAAVQTVAIAALLTLIWQQRDAEMNAPRFTTLTNTTATDLHGPILRVVLEPQMTNAQLQNLLLGVNAQIVSGPTEAGVYSLTLKSTPRIGSVTAVLEKVRATQGVIFAEHVSREPKP